MSTRKIEAMPKRFMKPADAAEAKPDEKPAQPKFEGYPKNAMSDELEAKLRNQ